MKALKCEMCSGNDFVKQDGLYVCQFCGTKYTSDEAKKLMIDGEVEVKGVMTLEKLAQNGETLLKLGRCDDARNVFHKLSCDYPEDYRGWWGMARAESADGADASELKSHIRAALAVAPENEREQLKKDAAKLLKKAGVKNGESVVKELEAEKKNAPTKLYTVLTIVFVVLFLAAAAFTVHFGIGTGAACVDSYKNGFDFDWFRPSLLTVVALAVTILFGLLANIVNKKNRR